MALRTTLQCLHPISRQFIKRSLIRPMYLIQRSFSAQASLSEEAPAFTLEDLKQLRSISGAPLKECKKALTETCDSTEDRITSAMDWLRIRGQAIAQQKSDQIAQHGFIAMIKEATRASLVEVNCVTDFVENNPTFQSAVLNIANTIVRTDTLPSNEHLNSDSAADASVIDFTTNEPSTQSIATSLTDLVSAIRENLVFRRAFKLQCTTSGVIGAYLHGRKSDNLGMKGALVSVETNIGADAMSSAQRESLEAFAKSVATHIVAAHPQPQCVRREEVSEAEVENERRLILESIKEKSGGAAQDEKIVQKQVEGRMRKFFARKVLMEQPFCLEDDDKLTVQRLVDAKAKEMGCDVRIVDMAVFNLGEAE